MEILKNKNKKNRKYGYHVGKLKKINAENIEKNPLGRFNKHQKKKRELEKFSIEMCF